MLLYTVLICLPLLAFGQDLLADQEFGNFDVDGDGHIETREIEQYFKRFDNDSDGRISREEYTHEVDTHHILNPQAHQTLINLFNRIDYNHDSHLDQSDYTQMFNNADADLDNIVSHQEFYNYFHQLTGGPILG